VDDLVRDRLSAAGHVVPIRSIYRWQGEVHDITEAHATLHTVDDHFPAIVARTEQEHPYEVPCVISVPISGASPAYLAWIIEQTRPE
jgi:periplasmic divalent cation tolerance protein